MCFSMSRIKHRHAWNWAGDSIVDSVLPEGRRIPGTRKAYRLDLREFIASPHNALMAEAMAALTKALPNRRKDLLARRGSGAYDERVVEVLRYFARRFVYDAKLDRSYDSWLFPDETIANGGGDCEDLAFLLASLILATGISGYTVRVAFGQVVDARAPDRPHDHAWVMYQTEAGQWLVLDPVAFCKSLAAKPKAPKNPPPVADPAPQAHRYAYNPHFVLNDAHLWHIGANSHAGSLVDYLAQRTFWSHFDPTFGVAAHNSIVETALAGLFTASDIRVLEAVSLEVDVNFAAYHPFDHFDSAYIAQGWQRVQERLSSGNFHDLGLALHSIGDFYAHSTYVTFAGVNARPFQPQWLTDNAGACDYTRPPVDLVAGKYTVNPTIWHGDGAARAAAWQGQIISGRFAQNGDPQQKWPDFERLTYIPAALRAQADYPNRGALPHHDEIAVDENTLKPGHLQFPDAAEYSAQYAARVRLATEHVREVASAWTTKFRHKPAV